LRRAATLLDVPAEAGRRPGMNRAPDRLYLAVVAVLCSCRLRANGER
jgi:hypothetical protein